MSQGGNGRDHHILGFSPFGATVELGDRAVENPISVHDLHATMLKLCGIDHKRLNMKFQGLGYRWREADGAMKTN